MLIEPDYYINKNIFVSFSKKIMGYSDDKNEADWFYVHFLTQNFQKIRKIINFSTNDMILKNTFILYLDTNQLEKIQKISLVKKLEQSDKFVEDGGSIENTSFLYVITAPNTSLPINPELYQIENYQDDFHLYIIKINDEGNDDKKIKEKKKKVIELLTSIHSIKLVSTFTHPQVKSSITVGFTQKNVPLKEIQKDDLTNIYYLPRYINDKGITGKGQIITIQDTDIDIYHDMFRDENQTIKFNQKMNHRKFIHYENGANDLDLSNSQHGTAVASLAAGKSIYTNEYTKGTSYFNGMAPDAKILYLNLDTEVEQVSYYAQLYNSYISSNSWGVGQYNSNLYNYKYGYYGYISNILFVFAAGNEYSEKYSTVCDPGGSKNVLTVGAIDEFYDTLKKYKVDVVNDSSLQFLAYSVVDADPWTEGYSEKDIKIIDVTLPNICQKINTRVINILYGPEHTNFSNILMCIDLKKIKSLSPILYTHSISTAKMIKAGSLLKITDITSLNLSRAIEHSAYSSKGPANKGIIKPDVVAPGTHIIAAKYNTRSIIIETKSWREENEGDFRYASGTSFSTPVVSGAAALIREYFQTGWWNPGNFSLNSYTLRALLINSCRHPRGKKKPDSVFGHGVVDISTVLPFDNSFGVQITDQLNSPEIREGEYKVAQLEVKSNKVDLQVTMSYLDLMTDQDSMIPLVVDLDLVLVSKTGRRFLGDHLQNKDTQHFSTNEKVIINKNEIEIGTYLVYVVTGTCWADIKTTGQRFGVVATGDIENKIMIFRSPNEDQENRCPCEKCNNNKQCICDSNHIGALCQTEIINTKGNDISLLIHESEIRTIKVSVKKGYIKEMNIQLTGSKGGNSTLWIDDSCHVTVFEYSKYYSIEDIMNGKIILDDKKKEICIAIFNNNFESATFKIDFDLTKSKSGLIVGIVIGVIALIAIIIILSLLLFKLKKCVVCPQINCTCLKINCTCFKINCFNPIINLCSCCNKRDISDDNSPEEPKKQKNNMETQKNSSIKREHDVETFSLGEINKDSSSTGEDDSSISNEYINNNNFVGDVHKIVIKRSINVNHYLDDQNSGSTDEYSNTTNETEDYQAHEKITPFPILDLKDIKKYDRVKKIGSGATSKVYKLRMKSNPEMIRALKVLDIEHCIVHKKGEDKPSPEYDNEKLNRFVRECEVINHFDHPNIIKTYGIFLGDLTNKPAILLEYCETNLKQQIQTLNKKEQISIIVSLSSAMEVLHSAGIIHRDLKLENVLLDSSNKPKLSDFGLCTFIDDDETRTEMAGTWRYMAPELFSGQKHYDEKVDVYAFGVVVFLILTQGDFPSISISEVTIGKKASIPSYISKFSSSLIKRCWSFYPSHRPSFADICLMLKGNEHKLIIQT